MTDKKGGLPEDPDELAARLLGEGFGEMPVGSREEHAKHTASRLRGANVKKPAGGKAAGGGTKGKAAGGTKGKAADKGTTAKGDTTKGKRGKK